MMNATATKTDNDGRQTASAIDGDLLASVDVAAMTTTRTSHSQLLSASDNGLGSVRQSPTHLDVCSDAVGDCNSATVT